MTDKEKQIQWAKTVADMVRPDWPEKAEEIDRAIIEAQTGQRDGVEVNVGVKFRLEKFHGDKKPGQEPYEVIEGED